VGLRFEGNFQQIGGVAPYLPDDGDPLTRWFRVHEWTVDPGYQANVLMLMLNVEPTLATPATANYGWMRVKALLDPTASQWATKWEINMRGAAMTARQTVPRLIILPCGSGIPFTAGQGLLTQALGGTTTVYRWWSCYVMDSQAA